MASIYQQDLKLTQTNDPGVVAQRVTLAISPTGDIELVEGKEKLSEQLIRAVVNEDTFAQGIGINSPQITTRSLNALINLILRNFRQSQISQTQQIDPICTGFSVYRFDNYRTTSTFVKVSPHPIVWNYADLNLMNGFVYTYAVARNYSTGYESNLLEKIDVTPSQFDANQNPIIGKNFVAIPGNQSVTVYVDYNRTFKKSELLENIEKILVTQDPSEPRRYIVDIDVRNLLGNLVSLNSNRYALTNKRG